MLKRLRDAYRQWRIRRRRWKLLQCYSRAFKIRTGKRVGFTPIMHARTRAVDEGLASFENTDDGTRFVWQWPEDQGGETA